MQEACATPKRHFNDEVRVCCRELRERFLEVNSNLNRKLIPLASKASILYVKTELPENVSKTYRLPKSEPAYPF